MKGEVVGFGVNAALGVFAVRQPNVSPVQNNKRVSLYRCFQNTTLPSLNKKNWAKDGWMDEKIMWFIGSKFNSLR